MDELIDKVISLFIEGDGDDEFTRGYNFAVEEYREKIAKLPSISVEEGEWLSWTTSKWTGKYNDFYDPEYKDYRYFQCKDCKRRSAIKEKYCPNCGRKMVFPLNNIQN